MPIGVVSDEDLTAELDSYNEKSGTSEIKTLERGRGAGRSAVPQEIRKVIASEAIINGHGAGKELAKKLDISESSVSAYQKGSTSTAMMDRPDPELKSHVNEERGRVAKMARDKLVSAINSLTEEKLADVSPRVAASVARDMASVVKTMEPERNDERSESQFVFLVPRMKKEEEFAVIDVKS